MLTDNYLGNKVIKILLKLNKNTDKKLRLLRK